MRTIPFSVLFLALSLTACGGVKEDTLHQRLAPVERQTEELQNDQQALKERLVASEAEMQRLRAELDALRPHPKGKKAVPPPTVVTPGSMVTGMAVPPPKILTPAQAAEEDRRQQGTGTTSLTAPARPAMPPHGPVPASTTSAATTTSTTSAATTTTTMPAALPPAMPPLASGTLAVTAPTSTTPGTPTTPATRPGIQTPRSTGMAPKPDTVPPPATPNSEQAAYKAALAIYEKGRFAEAEQLFDLYLQTWPSGKFAPNALYWKGECLYSRGRNADAVFVFKDVLTRFPKHPKAPDALLKSIMTYRQLGDADNARLHLSVLQEDYPSSPALKRAKEMNLDR